MHAKAIHRRVAPVSSVKHHWEQGLALSKKHDWAAAARAFAKACEGAPKDTLYRLNLARALMRAGKHQDARAQTQLVLDQEPANLLAYQMMGECFSSQGQHGKAASIMMDALKFCSPSAEYLQSLGYQLMQSQRFEDAIRVLMDALAIQIDHALSHYRLGLCFNRLDLKAEAVECFTTALALGIGEGDLACYSLSAFFRREQCDWSQADEDIRLMNETIDQLQPDTIKWSSVFASVTLTPDVERHLKAARSTANFFANGIKPLAPRPRPVNDRIRIGMVSADFHQHATCILMAELIEQIDRSVFEVFLYSHGHDDGSAMRQRVRAAADRFVDVREVSDLQVAEMIQDDAIDLLIDLKGHTANSRLGIFAYRPAPVQVSYLGFPGTTGANYIDYMIGDPMVSPLSEAHAYTEKIAQMPVCYQPNDRLRARPVPTTRAEHGLPEDAVVLCGFNQPFKISPEMLDVWCDLLHTRANTVLWLLDWHAGATQRLKVEVARRGIAPERVIFAPKLPSARHIARFALADVFIDIWPCNGHTTVSDALWAGVPVVTWRGESFASRVASSLLHAVGEDGLVCDNLDDYCSLVLTLIDTPQARDEIRARLVAARDRAPLFDTERYARDFEALLGRMVERDRLGLAPDHLPAASGGQAAETGGDSVS